MELDRDAQRILELARGARTPSADDKDRLGRRLAGAIALGATTAHAGAATTKAVAATWFAKCVVISVVAVAGGAGYLAVRPSSLPAPLAASNAPSPPDVEPRENTVTAPSTAPLPEAPSIENAVWHDEPRHRMADKSPAPRATLSEELDLLHEAQVKWRSGNASAALAVIGEHRARFPRSALGPERDALAILSLCATNRSTEAKRLARHFLATAPRSPFKKSVEESCAGK